MTTTRKRRATKRPVSNSGDCSAATFGVGRTKGGRIFLSVPVGFYDRATTPITRETRHIAMIDNGSAEWLIAAIAKEIGAERCRNIAAKLESYFCLVCDGTGIDPDELEGRCENCNGDGFFE